MNACADMSSSSRTIASIRKKAMFLRLVGTISLLSGITLGILRYIPPFACVLLSAFGGSWIAVSFTVGNAAIRDEMVKRVDMMSGYYSHCATLYFLFIIGILNFFLPLSMSVANMVLYMILFMSITFIGIRYFFLKRGLPE